MPLDISLRLKSAPRFTHLVALQILWHALKGCAGKEILCSEEL